MVREFNENWIGKKGSNTVEAIGRERIYGYELIIDLNECEVGLFNRASIDSYFTDLCDLIKMEKCEVYFWDDIGVEVEHQQTSPHTKGTSAVCFILTSTIVIHTLDLLESVFINIFSCKPFNEKDAVEFTANWFNSKRYNKSFINRVL